MSEVGPDVLGKPIGADVGLVVILNVMKDLRARFFATLRMTALL